MKKNVCFFSSHNVKIFYLQPEKSKPPPRPGAPPSRPPPPVAMRGGEVKQPPARPVSCGKFNKV